MPPSLNKITSTAANTWAIALLKYVSMNTRWKRRNIEEKEVILVLRTVYANDFMSVKLSREQNANYRDAYINQFTCIHQSVYAVVLLHGIANLSPLSLQLFFSCCCLSMRATVFLLMKVHVWSSTKFLSNSLSAMWLTLCIGSSYWSKSSMSLWRTKALG